nr:protein Frey 1 [Anolis sagrei ordinatus]
MRLWFLLLLLTGRVWLMPDYKRKRNTSSCWEVCPVSNVCRRIGLLAPNTEVTDLVFFHCRLSQSVPDEFTAPLELHQKHFGLVDDYGIKPQHLKFGRKWKLRRESEKLKKAHKTKRDEPNFEEYYDDDLF